MPDQSLEILIKTAADNYGIEKAWAELNKYKSALGESGKEVEHHNEGHREMRLLFRQLNQLLPESGHLLHGVFGGPQVLLIMATVAALAKLVEMVKEHNKALKESAELTAEVNIKVWQKHQEEIHTARLEYEKFNNEIAATFRNFDTLKQKQEEQLAVIKQFDEAESKAAKGTAREGIVERRQQGAGLVTQERVVSQLEQAFRDAQDKAETAQQARLAGAPGGAGAAESEARAKDAEAKLKKAQEEFDKIEDIRKQGGGLMGEATQQIKFGRSWKTFEDFNRSMEEAKTNLDVAKNTMASATAAQDAYKRKIDDLTRAVTEAENEMKLRAGQLQQARVELSKQRATVGASVEAADEQALLAAGVPVGSLRAPIGRTIQRGIEAFEQRGVGQHIGADQLKIIDGLVSTMQKAGTSNTKIYEIIKELLDSTVDHSKKIDDLWNAMKITRFQINSTVSRP